MPVRVKVEIKSKGSRVVTSALLNTGFTTLEPEVLVPKKLAEKLSLWPPPENSILESISTAGGEVLSYIVPKSIEVKVLASKAASESIVCNAIVSMHEREVLLSDALIEELKIEIISPKTGIWRFRGRPEEGSVRPEYW